MIYYVSGPVAVLEPGLAVIDCGGVGYGCRVTAYTAGQLKLNQPAKLFVTESIREDAFDLYGFISREEQRCYELLTSVNGVGPKAAMAILSAGGPQNFTLAVMTGDEKMLTAAQGVGKKIAQRIILELKDKIGGGGMELDFSGGAAERRRRAGHRRAAGTGLLPRGNQHRPEGRRPQRHHRRNGALRSAGHGYEGVTTHVIPSRCAHRRGNPHHPGDFPKTKEIATSPLWAAPRNDILLLEVI